MRNLPPKLPSIQSLHEWMMQVTRENRSLHYLAWLGLYKDLLLMFGWWHMMCRLIILKSGLLDASVAICFGQIN